MLYDSGWAISWEGTHLDFLTDMQKKIGWKQSTEAWLTLENEMEEEYSPGDWVCLESAGGGKYVMSDRTMQALSEPNSPPLVGSGRWPVEHLTDQMKQRFPNFAKASVLEMDLIFRRPEKVHRLLMVTKDMITVLHRSFAGQSTFIESDGTCTHLLQKSCKLPTAEQVYELLDSMLVQNQGDPQWQEVERLKVAVFAKQATESGKTKVLRTQHSTLDHEEAFAFQKAATNDFQHVINTQFVAPGDAFKLDHNRKTLTSLGGRSLLMNFDM